MKILVVVRGNPFTCNAGTEIFVKNLVFELTRRGIEIYLVYGYASKLDGDRLKGYEKLYLHGIYCPSLWLLGGLLFNMRLKRLLLDLIKSQNFNIIACHGAGQAYIFSTIETDSTLIYHAHDCVAEEYIAKKGITKRVSPLSKLRDFFHYNFLIYSEKKACTKADIVVANSQATLGGLVKHYGVNMKKIKKIYLGIPDDFMHDFTPSDPVIPTFLHIATEHKRKGTMVLLNAMRLLHKKHNIRVKAVVVGKRTLFYIRMAKQYHLDITFVEYVAEPTLKKLYAHCTCLVVPSFREGFCLPVIESAVFGKPSIVTNVGSLPELVEDKETGFIVKVGDIEGLADKMCLLVKDKCLRERMGQRAKERAKKFSIRNIAKDILNLYTCSSKEEKVTL